jgi:hypothetical protein
VRLCTSFHGHTRLLRRLVAPIAWSLFHTKSKYRRLTLYSIIEMGLRCRSCTFVNLSDVVEPIRLLGLVTSIYFLVRRLDNSSQVRDNRKATPIEPTTFLAIHSDAWPSWITQPAAAPIWRSAATPHHASIHVSRPKRMFHVEHARINR